MTVREIIDFLSKYDGEVPVFMVQGAHDNPLEDEIIINEIVAITSTSAEQPHLVVIPF